MHVWSRDRAGAEALWKSLPPVYRQCTVCYTDFWSAYEQVLPQNRHRAVGKESGKMQGVERPPEGAGRSGFVFEHLVDRADDVVIALLLGHQFQSPGVVRLNQALNVRRETPNVRSIPPILDLS